MSYLMLLFDKLSARIVSLLQKGRACQPPKNLHGEVANNKRNVHCLIRARKGRLHTSVGMEVHHVWPTEYFFCQ